MLRGRLLTLPVLCLFLAGSGSIIGPSAQAQDPAGPQGPPPVGEPPPDAGPPELEPPLTGPEPPDMAPPPQDEPAPEEPAPEGQQQPQGEEAGQGEQAEPQQPTFRAGINFVRVDVIVTDKKGTPVTDLAREEFEVFEDGERQEIESFKLFKIDEITETTPARPIRSTFDEESEAQRPDVRLFAFFLDDYHVRRGNAMTARRELAEFVRDMIAPQDLVGIMYPLTSTGQVVMGRNHESLARAIEQFDGRKYDYTPRNHFEERYANYPASYVELIRNQVSLSALKGLIIKLGGLREGRKALILVSEGYTNYLPPQMRDPIASLPGVGNPYRGDPFAGEGMGATRDRFFSQAEMISDLKTVFDLANRNNVAIYAVDPRGLAGFEHDINEGVGLQTDREMLRLTMDSVRILADNTDGRAIVNRNDLTEGMEQIVRDSSAYYLIGYNSTKAPTDGEFHEIDVKVKRKGTDVRHRQGYWALTAEETARAVAPPAKERPKDVDAALATLVRAPRAEYVRTWVGLSRGDAGKTRMTFAWEPVPKTPGSRLEESPSKVTLTVISPDGAPIYRGDVPDGSGGANGQPQRVSFDVPPGRVQMKWAVEDADSYTIDTDVRELAVPDLHEPSVSLSTPLVFSASTGLEQRKLEEAENPVPDIGREFRRTERLIVRAQAYGPGTEQPGVTARLLSRSGDAMRDLPVTALPASHTSQVELPLSGLAPGEYLIEMLANGEGGEAKQLVAFRVVS